jgi:DNA-binding CsgD family transcriptional regulator
MKLRSTELRLLGGSAWRSSRAEHKLAAVCAVMENSNANYRRMERGSFRPRCFCGHPPASVVNNICEIAVTRSCERNRSMSPVSKLAALILETEVPASTDREVLTFPESLLSRWDVGYARGRPAQLGSLVSDTLTARERDVLVMISQGRSNKRIARDLCISPETVKSHVKRIFLKLAVSTRAEAAFRAVSLGLL